MLSCTWQCTIYTLHNIDLAFSSCQLGSAPYYMICVTLFVCCCCYCCASKKNPLWHSGWCQANLGLWLTQCATQTHNLKTDSSTTTSEKQQLALGKALHMSQLLSFQVDLAHVCIIHMVIWGWKSDEHFFCWAEVWIQVLVPESLKMLKPSVSLDWNFCSI